MVVVEADEVEEEGATDGVKVEAAGGGQHEARGGREYMYQPHPAQSCHRSRPVPPDQSHSPSFPSTSAPVWRLCEW